jgi:hypothetical protein
MGTGLTEYYEPLRMLTDRPGGEHRSWRSAFQKLEVLGAGLLTGIATSHIAPN